MSNVRKVFWSWQSDQAERETRHLIRESLVQALNMLTGRTTLDERIEIDHDTKGMPGSPDIVSSILEKIDGADVFVADITPIAISKGGKHVANPNVLIELGYAKKALGLSKIVTVWNIAFTKSRPENLPFDLRGRRGPLTYSLDKDASRTELAKARALLVQGLAERVGACLRSPSAPTQAKPRWHDSIDEDKSIWVKPGQSIAINEAWGSGYKTVAYGGRWYVRVIPTAWSASWLEPISHGPVVGSYGGFSAGHTAEGLMTYAGSVRSSAPLELEAASMWFEDTGEIWSFQNRVGDDYKGRLVFFGDYIPHQWANLIGESLALLSNCGAVGPYHIRVGVTGLSGLQWDTNNFSIGEPPVALRSSFESDFAVSSKHPDEWRQPFVDCWSKMRRVFSMPAPTPAEVSEALRKAVKQ